mmetsp:Transcript_18967/g.40955  ORF Transcript_18967/g.40955 Transcript_18967/m.40955 type:complete len:211 (-) Transcript_18967:561-1193(-)
MRPILSGGLLAPSLQPTTDEVTLPRRPLHDAIHTVSKAGADGGVIVHHGDVQPLQRARVANAGEEQQLRTHDGARTQNHLLTHANNLSRRVDRRRAPKHKFNRLHALVFVEKHTRHERVRQNGDRCGLRMLANVRGRRRVTYPVTNHELIPTHTLAARAVEIANLRHARRRACFDKRLGNGVVHRTELDVHRPVACMQVRRRKVAVILRA